jgi:hypothetical protein
MSVKSLAFITPSSARHGWLLKNGSRANSDSDFKSRFNLVRMPLEEAKVLRALGFEPRMERRIGILCYKA